MSEYCKIACVKILLKETVSPERLQKLSVSPKFPERKLGGIAVSYAVNSERLLLLIPLRRSDP